MNRRGFLGMLASVGIAVGVMPKGRNEDSIPDVAGAGNTEFQIADENGNYKSLSAWEEDLDGRSTARYQSDAPKGQFHEGDLWIDTAHNYKTYVWNGKDWESLDTRHLYCNGSTFSSVKES